MPVTASTTAPSARNAIRGVAAMKLIAYQGFTARSTSGLRRISRRPSTASTTNHAHMTGPNRIPTLAVPRFWIANSARMMTSVTGTTNGCSAGAITSSPSTAPSTEMAGVIIPSP